MTERISIDGIPMGGEMGENATVMIGSIFYDRHRIVQDMNLGIFDEVRAEELIKQQDEWAAKTGCPAMIDVIGSTPEAIRRYLTFTVANSDSPVLVDGSSPAVRLAGMAWCADNDLLDRAVYNSLSAESKQVEFDALKELGCKSAILLCMNATDFTLKGRLRVLEGDGSPGLLERAKAAGIENILVDPGIVDIPSMGTARAFQAYVKERHGAIVGAAPHNAISCWTGLRSRFGRQAVRPCTGVTDVLMTAWGGDFVLYGPIAHAELAFPVVALVDAALGQIRLEEGHMPSMNHPMFKIA
jgi:tetrahydromethanopterin S-methyltransferase subunit H